MLMGDFNEDVREGKTKSLGVKRGLSEKIIQQNGNNPPATHEHKQ